MKWIAKNQELKINTHIEHTGSQIPAATGLSPPLSGHLLLRPPRLSVRQTRPSSYSWKSPRFLLSQDLCAFSLFSRIDLFTVQVSFSNPLGCNFGAIFSWLCCISFGTTIPRIYCISIMVTFWNTVLLPYFQTYRIQTASNLKVLAF